MPLFHIVILALVQGITEFLPISSSGHLVLTHHFLEHGALTDRWGEDLMMDVAVHVGTLLAILLYFRKDVWLMITGIFTGDKKGRTLFGFVVLGSLPVIAAGFALELWEPQWLRSVQVVAWTTLIFGIVLWAADRFARHENTMDAFTFKHAILIGLAQILALIPGTSRSGITMTAARALGFSRIEAARYSMLLAMVAISGAGTLKGLELFQSENMALGLDVGLAIVLSFVSALVTVILLMKWLKKSSFTPFAIYRVLLGVALLAMIYSGVLQ